MQGGPKIQSCCYHGNIVYYGVMKKIVVFLLLVALVVGIFVFARPYIFQEVIEEAPIVDTTLQIPSFEEVGIDFVHHWNKKANLAFSGGALVDVDGDGVQEVFVTGGMGQNDGLFQYQDDGFVNITAGSGLSSEEATYGALSLDLEADGDVDLLVARESGVYQYFNDGKGKFSAEKLALNLAENTVPLSITAGDINKDGFVDLYVSTFVNAEEFMSATFNKPEHGKPNIFLVNDQRGGFTDLTVESGLDLHMNTFLSSFVDLDSDGWLDLVVAENTGKVRVYENVGGLKFVEVEVPIDYGYWMGLAIDDVDGDGDMDIFATNIGNTIPVAAASGDLRDDQVLTADWVLLRNEGEFQFVDATKELGLSGYEFAWGAWFDDFNLDGLSDLVVLENYIKWPAHKLSKAPGRFFVQDFEGKFVAATEQSGLVNENFGMSPLVSDFNQDGYPDLILVNIEGPLRAFINKGGLDHHYLKVKFAERAENYGARVTVERGDGVEITKQLISGMGLLSDSGGELFFGLGKNERINSLTVVWPSGESEVLEDVAVDTVVNF